MPAITDNALAVKALARQHQEAIWALHQTISRLRSVLLEFYPQALQVFPNLKHRAAMAVLSAAPTPAQGLKLTDRRVVALLHRCGRRNDPALVEAITSGLKTPALRQPPQVEAALGRTVASLVRIITAMLDGVDDLERALSAEFDIHPIAPVLRSAPGLGPVLAARGAVVGMDRGRHDALVRENTVRDEVRREFTIAGCHLAWSEGATYWVLAHSP